MLNIKQFTNYDNLPIEGEYRVITFASPAIKLGYCGDVLSIGKNIILTINGEQKTFEIGKTGMFEFHPETWEDMNEENNEEKEAIIYVDEIRVPIKPDFVLDYCYYAS